MHNHPHTTPLRIAIAGLGNVGASLVNLLASAQSRGLNARSSRPIELVAVCARNKNKDRGITLSSSMLWCDDAVKIANAPNVDVFVELIGGSEGVARTAVEAALNAGKHVVTANKALLAAHGNALAALAEQKGVSLNFEASVAGGIPIVKTLRESLCGNSPTRVMGILNGTCNYILTRMEAQSEPFDVCLKAAQELGYAEADPTFDIDGFDTAHKLSILTSLAFGTQIHSEIQTLEGIRSITYEDIAATRDLGYRIKLLGIAQRIGNTISQSVQPTLLPHNAAIADVGGATNAVLIDADFMPSLLLVGAGAGGNPTASAVAADIIDIARGLHILPFGQSVAHMPVVLPAQADAISHRYYVRFAVQDKPGAFATIATHMAQQNISLESIVQHGQSSSSGIAQVILVTHKTTAPALHKALDAISNAHILATKPQSMCIESL